MAWRVRLVAGETEAAVEAREEDVTSASCSRRRSWSWVSAKWGIERGVGGAIWPGGGIVGYFCSGVIDSVISVDS